jgi:hypothetical protein
MTLSAMVARPTGRNWVRADRFGGRCKAFLCRGGTHQGTEAGALHGSALRQQGQVSGRDFRSQSTNLPACRGPNTHRSQGWCRIDAIGVREKPPALHRVDRRAGFATSGQTFGICCRSGVQESRFPCPALSSTC